MIAGIIPARYASTRFPGKPLIDILGKSMIQRVYEEASKSKLLDKIVVATDDERILAHVESFGGNAVMTAATHPSGTDRCYDALQQLGDAYNYVINIQGDEPFIDPTQIDELAAILSDGTVELATQMIPVNNHEELFDRGEVKIVLNDKMEALYFSRMVIPFIKGVEEHEWHKHHRYYRHVGMYASTALCMYACRYVGMYASTALSFVYLYLIIHAMHTYIHTYIHTYTCRWGKHSHSGESSKRNSPWHCAS